MPDSSSNKGNPNTSTAITTFEIDMGIDNKDDNNTWRNIYEAIHEIYFEEGGFFTDEFPEWCKRNPNVP